MDSMDSSFDQSLDLLQVDETTGETYGELNADKSETGNVFVDRKEIDFEEITEVVNSTTTTTGSGEANVFVDTKEVEFEEITDSTSTTEDEEYLSGETMGLRQRNLNSKSFNARPNHRVGAETAAKAYLSPPSAASSGWGLKFFLFLVVVGLAPAGYTWYNRLQSNRVVSPLNVHRVLSTDATSAANSPERFWGTYRPGVYFGMKTRSPRSLVTGLMWFRQFAKMKTSRHFPLRHTCEQSDALPRYGWLKHDGVNFGVQEILEDNYTLTTEFVKVPGGRHGGDWSVRIKGAERKVVAPTSSKKAAANQTKAAAPPMVVSLLFYAATDQQGQLKPQLYGSSRLTAITGQTEELGSFTLKFPTAQNATKWNYLRTHIPSLDHLANAVRQSTRFAVYNQTKHYLALQGDLLAQANLPEVEANLLVHQVTLTVPFELEVVFESGSSASSRKASLSGDRFTAALQKHKAAFDHKFEEKFQLKAKGYRRREWDFAQAALSNLLGGIGYFHGQSIVQSQYSTRPALYWQTGLYTAVPSRSFFPRGFLWDEGFHNLVILHWDSAISMDIIGHWLDLMNADGWIPREQILGAEALSKVPQEFVVQHNENANPPTFFLPLEKLIQQLDSSQQSRAFLAHIYPRLQAWFNWYNSSQLGLAPSSYRWRGRNASTEAELNPKTLTSGLDDFPRSSHPSESERHVDLRCWMALASGVLANLARQLDRPWQQYQATHAMLTDNALLDRLHWSPRGQMYSDYGNHAPSVALERPQLPPPKNPASKKPPPKKPPPNKLPMRRVVKTKGGPTERFVDSLGYVSLFPFLLQILEPDSPNLGKILGSLNDTKLLWTNYGLRSLSRSDPIYKKYNTEHDPPYWRGQIWINMNYLALRALHGYARAEGPHRAKAQWLYSKLRSNIITNMVREYQRTGYIWEQYDDLTGQGKGSHPFTGWSSLVILAMSEQF